MDIVQGCKLNNRRAQNLLFEELHSKLVTVAKKFFNEPDIDIINDIVQDSFINAFRDIQKFQGSTLIEIRNWITIIIRNKCMDYHRSSKKYIKAELHDNILDEQDPESIYEKYFKYIDAAISVLPEQYKNVFCLYYKENLTHSEIANELGISISSSKTDLMRAKQNMKKYFTRLKLEE